MNTATLLQPALLPSKIIFFPGQALFTSRMDAAPSCGRRGGDSKGETKTPSRPRKEEPADISRLAELFALKRQETPPENFMENFIAEFGRRNYGSDRIA